jgi:2-succinyl-6-hydroxy-2,4-cyclohexadiene-1-carboxylate synthase
VPRLIALHGFAGHPDDFSDLRAALSTVEFLSPWLPGHGPNRFAETASGDFASEVLGWWQTFTGSLVPVPATEALPWLLGYSLGGRLALELALSLPGQFAGLILIGTHPGLTSEEARAERRDSDARWVDLLRSAPMNVFFAAWDAQPLLSSRTQRLAPVARSALAERRSCHQADGLAESLQRLGTGAMPDQRPRLPSLRLPVLLLHGEEDAKFATFHAEMARLLPRATRREVPQSGHAVPLENPADLAEIIKSFLAAHG